MKRTILSFTLASLAAAPFAPTAAQTVEIKEWPVPFAGRPRDPFVDPTNGSRVWFVGQTGHYVAYLDATTGEFKRFDLDPNAGPHNLILDKQGVVWYAGNGAGSRHIGRLDPASGQITRFPMSDSTVRDPHTLIFDGNGDIWFTAQQSHVVGKLTVATGKTEFVRFPMIQGSVNPYGIAVDRSGQVWFNAFATNKIGMIDPKTMTPKMFDLSPTARSRRIAVTSDQMIWYVDFRGGNLGRLNPATGEVKEWPAPGGAGSQPYAMTVDDKDRIWFVESAPRNANKLVGFDTKSESFFSITPIPSGGGTVRHMVYHAPDRSIWFGTDTGNIARAVLPQ